LPAERLDGNDLPALVERARDVVAGVRRGEGPHFFEVMTYRWQEHVGPGTDYHIGYREEAEAQAWINRDAVPRMRALVDVGERLRIEQEVERENAEAFAFAEASPFPEAAELGRDVFKE